MDQCHFLSNILSSILNSLGSIAVALFSIVFISFFFLQMNTCSEIIMTATPTRMEEKMKEHSARQ